jgi:tetratricopeptide (TPR) repeat protein
MSAHCRIVTVVAFGIFPLAFSLHAEQGKLTVYAEDVQGKPVVNLRIGLTGPGGGPQATDSSGRAILSLPSNVRANTWVTLQIVTSPPKHDFVILSPWDRRTLIPSTDTGAEQRVPVVVIERGDKFSLANPKAAKALAEQISGGPRREQQAFDPRKSLAVVATKYGLPPEDVDIAIRTWGKHSRDPYDVGMAAFYSRDLDLATSSLTRSLELRGAALDKEKADYANAAYFLGEAQFDKGRYAEATTAYRKALSSSPDDFLILNSLASAYLAQNLPQYAEPLLRSAMLQVSKAVPPQPLSLMLTQANLASALQKKHQYDQAKAFFQQSLKTAESMPLTSDVELGIATIHNDIGILYKIMGDFGGALQQHQLALNTRLRILGSENSNVGMSYGNIGAVRFAMGDFVGAEGLDRKALSILVSTLGRLHPITATATINLARTLEQLGKRAEANSLYRRLIADRRRAFGANDIPLASAILSLAEDLNSEGRATEAAKLLSDEISGLRAAAFPDPNQAVIYMTALGDLWFIAHRDENAIRSYEEAVQLCSRRSCTDNRRTFAVHAKAGDTYIRLKKPKEAKAEFEAALNLAKIDGEPSVIARLTKRLEILQGAPK